MVLWREVSQVRALEAGPQVLGSAWLAPGLEYGVSKSEAKWLDLQTRGLGDEPEALFVRRRSKPPHKRQGFGQ
jgi:hypothetical protein